MRGGRAAATRRGTGAAIAQPGAEPYSRPAEFIYAVDETPPPRLALIGLQYAVMTALHLIIVAIILCHVGLPARDSAPLMGVACLALGVGTALQALPRGPVGSGFLAPPVFSATYLGPSIVAPEPMPSDRGPGAGRGRAAPIASGGQLEADDPGQDQADAGEAERRRRLSP